MPSGGVAWKLSRDKNPVIEAKTRSFRSIFERETLLRDIFVIAIAPALIKHY